MVLLSANLGGAHSLLPECRGARRADVLQHRGSKLSAWTQPFDITHGFEMLYFRCFKWLTSESGRAVKNKGEHFQVEKRKFSHAAVITRLHICSNTGSLLRENNTKLQFSQKVCFQKTSRVSERGLFPLRFWWHRCETGNRCIGSH